MGLPDPGAAGHFIQVRVNPDLALDHDNPEHFESHPYAFVVGEREFDEIFGRLKRENVSYGARPNSQWC